jgi:hypothetical protein
VLITFSHRSFALVLPHLLQRWPDKGFRSKRSAKRILATLLDQTERGRVHINPYTPRSDLRNAGVKVARLYTTPWKYTKYFQKSTDINKAAIKIRPGVILPLTIGGVDTTAYVQKARRLNFRGSPNYLKLELNLDTEHLPLWIERESKCDCRYCGAPVVDDEVSCLKCGAPLPSC